MTGLLVFSVIGCALSVVGIWLLTDHDSFLSRLADREPRIHEVNQ